MRLLLCAAIVTAVVVILLTPVEVEPCDQACWHAQMCAQPRYHALTECQR